MDYYSVLGLAPGASPTDIKRAYRRLSRRYHPGINPGDRAAASLFQRITEAYETLADADRRRRYDDAGVQAQAGERTFEFSGFDFSVAAQGSQAATFSELFAEALHPLPKADRGERETGADLHASVSLSFDQAMRGTDQHVMVTRQVTCGSCAGAGQLRTVESRCTQCHGSGNVRWARGHMVFTKACAGCGGTGRERHRRCAVCAGHGRVVRSDGVAVRVPAGVVDGTRLRVAERGHAGARGGRPGDLYVDVHVRPHAVLRREGADLHMTVPIAIHEAALGTRVELPSFDGPVKLRVPPGTQAGQRFRISGRGAVTITGGRGELWIEVRVTLPAMLDERSKELMREFARLHQEDVRQDLVKQLQAEG